MASQEVIFALDLGTTKVEAAVARRTVGGLSLLGFARAPCLGLKKGVVTDLGAAADSIRTAAERAQRMAGVELDRAWVGITGPHVTSFPARGGLVVAGRDHEITRRDLEEVIEAACRDRPFGEERQLLHRLVRSFRVDGEDGVAAPLGMRASRLEAELLLVAGSSNFLANIEKSVARAGLGVRELVFGPIATADAVLHPAEQELGVLLADLGGTTTDFALFYRGAPLRVGSLPVGAGHVSQDLAIGLGLSKEEAEKLKLDHSCALADAVPEEEQVATKTLEGARTVSRRLVASIAEARMQEVFSLLGKAVAEIPERPPLACGLVLTGGGALLPGAVELAQEVLGVKARLARPRRLLVQGRSQSLEGPAHAAALGLLYYAEKEQRASRLRPQACLRPGEAWRAAWRWARSRFTE